MGNTLRINDNWGFVKEVSELSEVMSAHTESVTFPHT